MSLVWPHQVTITAPGTAGSGAFNAEDVWVPAAEGGGDPLHSGPAFVNDKGRAMSRDAAGRPLETSDAVVYLRTKDTAGRIPLDAVVHVRWNPGRLPADVSDAVVVRVVRAENSLDVRRV